MLKTIEKFWPLISILFLVAILTSLFFWPPYSRPLGWMVMVICPLMVIVFTLRRDLQAHRLGQSDRPGLVRNLGMEVAGILLTVAAAVLIAGKVAPPVGLLVGKAAEAARPGTGSAAGILAGLLSAVLVGLGVGLLVRWTWGRLAGSKRSSSV